MNRDAEQKKDNPKVVQQKPMNPPTKNVDNKPEDDGGMEIIPNDEPKNEQLPQQDIEEPNDDNSVELGDIDDQGNEVVVVTNDEGEQV